MTKKAIYIGIDGGGTKSKAYVVNDAGEQLGTAIGGPSNIRLSVDVAWNSIYDAIEKVLAPHQIQLDDSDYAFHLGLGLAGVEVPADRKEFLNRPHPFKTILLESDAYAACLGAHNNQDGAIIIIGTGVNGYQVQQGEKFQVSGWGFPHDDIGGGAWLGLNAASLTLQWLDGRIDGSPLLEAIYQQFDHDQIALVAWANAAKSTQFATLAPQVIQFIKQDDPNALQLIKQAAGAINAVGHAMDKHTPDRKLPISLFGGVAPFIRPWLDENLQRRLVERVHDASIGAVFMIKNHLGIPL